LRGIGSSLCLLLYDEIKDMQHKYITKKHWIRKTQSFQFDGCYLWTDSFYVWTSYWLIVAIYGLIV
jgi:hypothetical protein